MIMTVVWAMFYLYKSYWLSQVTILRQVLIKQVWDHTYDQHMHTVCQLGILCITCKCSPVFFQHTYVPQVLYCILILLANYEKLKVCCQVTSPFGLCFSTVVSFFVVTANVGKVKTWPNCWYHVCFYMYNQIVGLDIKLKFDGM